ncbi:MAG: hypothetical protein ACKOCX_04815 [Planctomycetota bacterium]
MKRPALSLNPAGIGGFFAAHGEKLLLAAVGVVSLLLVWWGIDAVRSQAVTQDRRPAAIAELAAQAKANIDLESKVPAERLPNRQPITPLIDPWRPQQVTIAEPPANRPLLSRPLFAELTKRTKPAVFPIEDLRAVAGIAVLPDPRASEIGVDMAPRLPEPAPLPEEKPRRRSGKGRGRDRDGEQPPDAGLLGLDGGLGMEAQPLSTAEPRQPGIVTPFVVVTGLIPAARQRAEYERLFAATSFRDPRRDSPLWGEYLVERARVVPGGGGRWERLEVKNVERSEPGGRIGMAQMPGGPDGQAAATPLEQETLPPAFFLQPEETEIGYVAALPERIDEPWGPAAVHPWFVPQLEKFLGDAGASEPAAKQAATISLTDLLKEAAARSGEEFRLEDVVLEAGPARQRDVGLYKFAVTAGDGATAVEIGTIGQAREPVFAVSERWARQLSIDGTSDKPQKCNLRVRVDRVGKTPVARILQLELRDDAGEVIDTRTDPDPTAGGGGEGAGPMMGPMAGPEGLGPEARLAENRLFRFVDTTVKPGETYRYRVKFALRNPNVRLPARHLADPAAAKAEFLISDYSNETPPIRVPSQTMVLARTIDRDTSRKMKIKGDALEVMILAPSEKTGNFALRSVVTDVGGLANVDMDLNKAGDTRFFGETVATDHVLVDARGPQIERADNRPAEPAEPLEMLFLRPDGSFESVAAADSERRVRQYGDTLFKPGTKLPDDSRAERDNRDAREPAASGGKPPAGGLRPSP